MDRVVEKAEDQPVALVVLMQTGGAALPAIFRTTA
jgi:hypothetical protein